MYHILTEYRREIAVSSTVFRTKTERFLRLFFYFLSFYGNGNHCDNNTMSRVAGVEREANELAGHLVVSNHRQQHLSAFMNDTAIYAPVYCECVEFTRVSN